MTIAPSNQDELIEESAALDAPFAALEIAPPFAADPKISIAPSAEPMTQGRVARLAAPIIGENVLQTAVGAVDTMMVAMLGSAALAGVGAAAELVFFIIAILSAVDIGATILVSQAIGAGDSARANQFARQAITWGALLAIPVSVLGFVFAPAIISVFHVEPDVAEHAITYFQITAGTSLALLLSFMCGAILRGAGDSRTPLAAAVLANIINIIVAWVLIFGHFGFPELGVAGSAIGAATGRAVSAALMLTLMFLGKLKLSLRGPGRWLPDLTAGRELFALGIPAGFGQMLISGGFTAMVGIVAMISTDALAAQQVAFTALGLGLVPGFGFEAACTALVGQSIGARDINGARKALAISMRFGLITLGGAAIIYFLFADQIMNIFTSAPAVHEAGVAALHAICLSLPFWAMWSIGAGAQRGARDTRMPMLLGVIPVWLTVLLSWIGVTRFDFDLVHVWLCYVVTIPPAAALNWWFARRRLNQPIDALVAAGI